MDFATRLRAAFTAFRKPPQPRANLMPLWSLYSNTGQPQRNFKINVEQLRAFSESPIPRRAIDYIRNQIMRLDRDIVPLDGKRWTAAQRKEIEKIKRMLRRPNYDDNWSSFIGQIVEDMLVLGMGVFEIREWKDGDNPYVLYPVDAGSIYINLAWDGNPKTPRYAQYDANHRQINFTVNQLAVLKHNPRSNTPWGLSPLEVACQQIQYLLEAQSYAGKTASSALPKKLLDLGEELTTEQVNEFRVYFKNEVEGRSHLPVIGGTKGAKTLELGHVGDQALFLQWQQFLIAVIACAFNLDVMKFNAVVGINRSTGDTLDDISDEGAIRPMAAQIEHYMNQFILSRFEVNGVNIADIAEFKFRFNTSYTDRKSLAVIHQILLQMDALTINEARREMGLPDLPEDPKTKKSKGDLTLSEYRAMYGGQVNIDDARGIDNEFGPIDMPDDNTPDNGGETDPNGGGNNGVHGMPTPKEKVLNQRTDKGLDVSL